MARAGPAGDCPQALALLEGLAVAMLIADTSYESDENRVYCAQKQIEVVIPNRPNRKHPAPVDENYYEDRNKIERFRFGDPIQSHETVPATGHPLRKNGGVFSGVLACGRGLRLVTLIVHTL